MANSVILGSDLMLFKDGKALAVATSCKMTISANAMDTSSKDSGKWTEKKAGKLSWNGSSDNLFVMADYKSLVDIMISREKVSLQFSTTDAENGVPTSGFVANKDGYKGDAIITSIDMNAPDGENATYTVSFEGTGALTAVTA